MQVERDHLLLLDVQAGLFDDCGMGILRVLVEGTSELTACLFAPSLFVSSHLSSHHPVFRLIIPSFIPSSHLLSHHPVFCLVIPSFLSSSGLSFRHPVVAGCTLPTLSARSISLFAITI